MTSRDEHIERLHRKVLADIAFDKLEREWRLLYIAQRKNSREG